MYTFRLPIVSKPRQTQADRWKQRPCVMKYRAFADELRKQAEDMDFVMKNSLHVAFYFSMPKTWSKVKKEKMTGCFHDQKPDIDNLIKAVMDALMKEDKTLGSISLAKYWTDSEEDYITIQDCSVRI